GNVKRVRRRRFAGRSGFRRRGRLGEVGDFLGRFLLGRDRPETGHPLPALASLTPVARHPLLAWWRRTPGTTDPEEIVAILVPGPVAADPHDIAFRLLRRRHFLQRHGRLFRNGLGWLGISYQRSKGFMH